MSDAHSSSAAAAGMAARTPTGRATAPWRLRQAMGRFATGVTIITTAEGGEIHGMTANGVLSVSLDPPLVLVSLGRCRMAELLPASRRYGVSILSAEQAELAQHFAGGAARVEQPPFVWHEELPFIEGALAHVGCRVHAVHEAGDHCLWIGRVEHMHHRDGSPLLFYAGRFGELRDGP